MLSDLAETSGVEVRETEICIVGAGAAGLTIARRLTGRGHHVVLLESGGRDWEAATADLNAGENVGEPYYPLDHARLRFFGGTTAIWGGRCAELDPLDLEAKSWVPHSGWPISHRTLRPYYDEAWPLFGHPAAPPGDESFRAAGVPLPRFDPDRLVNRSWAFDNRFSRFAFESCRDLVDHPRCEIILHASVTSIGAAASGKAVERVTARALGGATLSVKARVFILAAGGIENPRLLLASNDVMPAGLGNEHGNVGRFFMEHPHARGGRIVEGDAWALLKAFGRRHRVAGRDTAALIAPSPKLQEERGILNSSLVIVGRQPERASQFWGMRAYSTLKHDAKPTRGGRALWMATKRGATFAQRLVDPLRPWLLQKMGRLDLALLLRAEQAPNPDSRVTLAAERDSLGVPRVRLDWRLSPLDVESAASLVETLGEELARLGLGRVEPSAWLSDPERKWRTDPLVSSHPIGGYHHMGTTRMSDDPRRGVTDPDTRVHGLGNLYVAGSSLFPTSGWANPTLTIVALALRTADEVVDDASGRGFLAMDSPRIEAVGHNHTLLWGLTNEERVRRIAGKFGLGMGDGVPRILVNLAFAFDPSWLKWIADHPGQVVTREGEPVLAHCMDAASAGAMRRAMVDRRPFASPAATIVAQETSDALHNLQLRKRERPFIERLTPESAAAIERRSYQASYKGVTDLLTKYLWPEWALHLTRLAARLGLSPNAVTFIGALFCVAAGVAFYRGDYWPGLAAALVFMVLDTVDGKLARCTITSSRLGDMLDHGIDLVHPLIWWWAWGMGLAAYGRPIDPSLFWTIMAALAGGYVAQRAIEGAFILWFGMHIHVWERLDTQFRLITARRNPNMVLLFASMLAARPDIGLLAVAAWTILSCLFHLVRIVQARLHRRRAPIRSWLEGP